jgi:hypothetical protein
VFARGETSKVLDERDARHLGFGGAPPAYLEWRKPGPDAWKRIAVNGDFGHFEKGEELGLAELLFREYAGRPLPKPATRPGHRDTVSGGDLDPEEKELTRSLHQGDLDACVLQWRLVANRIRQVSGKNAKLLVQRVCAAIRSLERDVRRRPADYSEPKVAFIRALLESMWPR